MRQLRSIIGAAVGELLGGEVVQFEIEHDKIGVVPAGQLEAFVRAARREGSHSAAFQDGLQHFASFFRLIDDQDTALPIQGYTLRGELSTK